MKTQNSSPVMEAYDKYVLNSYMRTPIVFKRGQGSYVWDENGKRYLDFGGGIAVNCLGHAHPRIQKALARQSAQLIHVSNLYYHEGHAKLAERLVKWSGPGRVFFCNSGAEANEALYKLARRFGHETGRYEVITTINSFHGRTLAGIAATGQDKVKKGFDPIVPGFKHVPFNDLAAMEAAITPQTAAVLIEGIQGEGGVYPATPEYLLGLRALCDQKGILLLMDSVQCGIFRTGKFQSYQRILEGVSGAESFRPDAFSMAKSLGGGFPIGAAWFDEKHASLLGPGSHGTTFGGTPLACAVALEVLDVIEEEKLAANIMKQGERVKSTIQSWNHPKIKGVRGFGGMIGFEITEPSREAAARLREAGLLTVPAGDHVLRILPPLNASDAEIDEALEVLQKTL